MDSCNQVKLAKLELPASIPAVGQLCNCIYKPGDGQYLNLMYSCYWQQLCCIYKPERLSTDSDITLTSTMALLGTCRGQAELEKLLPSSSVWRCFLYIMAWSMFKVQFRQFVFHNHQVLPRCITGAPTHNGEFLKEASGQ